MPQPTPKNLTTTNLSGWAVAPLRQRLAWVARFRSLVASNLDDLCALAEEEIGKPPFETLTADLLPVLANCKWLEKRAARVLRDQTLRGGGMLGMGQTQTVRREPLGRVAIIATWNYPLGLLGVELLAALVTGNTVVVKPSENAPRTQAALLRLAFQAGLPNDALSSVEPTREAGEALLREHAFNHVVFTGSTAVGTKIAKTLAPTLTPSTLELSGRDSAFVLADADTALAARTLWFMVQQNGGQTCMAPRRILVERPAYAAFIRDLGLYAAGAQPRKLISESAAVRTHKLAAAAIAEGGRSISGVLEAPDGPWLRPLAIVNCPESAGLVAGDHFGPATAIVPVESETHALEIHRRCDQHLATSVYTRKHKQVARRLAGRLGATTVNFNNCVIPTAHPAASIGGVGPSGWGVSQGEAGLLAMTRPVYVSRTHPVLRPPTDTPPPHRVAQMTRMIAKLYGGTLSQNNASSTTTPTHTTTPATGPATASPATIGDAKP
ncbi:MAG: aldehyde dehydrogenase family protein [Planctomycetota bacterium]